MDNIERRNRFKAAIQQAWEEHQFGSIRDTSAKLDIGSTVLHDMKSYGRVPSMPILLKWADGIGESRDKWIELAGYGKQPPAKMINHDVVDVDGVLVYLRHHGGDLPIEALQQLADVVRRKIEEKKKKKE